MCHSLVLANMLSTPPPIAGQCNRVRVSGASTLFEKGTYVKQEGTQCGGQPIYNRYEPWYPELKRQRKRPSYFLYFLNETQVWAIGKKLCTHEVSEHHICTITRY